MFFKLRLREEGGEDSNARETGQTFCTRARLTSGIFNVFFFIMHHIWISVICAPLTLSDPVRRGLSLSCNVTPWKAAGSAL